MRSCHKATMQNKTDLQHWLLLKWLSHELMYLAAHCDVMGDTHSVSTNTVFSQSG